MTMTSRCVNACLEAWMRCEHLLKDDAQKHALVPETANLIDECALICMGAFHALKNGSANAARMAVLCVGICEECAETCERFSEECFSQCAAACRRCSEDMSVMAFASLN